MLVNMTAVPYNVYVVTVLKALNDLIGKPEPDHPLRADLADEYSKNRTSFVAKAKQHTINHGEKRP